MAVAAPLSTDISLQEVPLEPPHVIDENDPFEAWSTFNLDWLYDPNRFDHLPIEEQLDLYKKRDLTKTKYYKFAAKIWGPPRSRKRVIIAPPMYTGDDAAAKAPAMNSQLKPRIPPEKHPSSAEIRARKERDTIESYQSWVNQRKTFRKDLENMGLNEEWLSRKPNKTPLEQRVLRRLIEERNPRIPTPPPKIEMPLEPILADESPVVKRPSPLAIRIIEKFLHQHKMRLIDLFQSVDKNKNWKVSRDEFRRAIQEANIPISEVLLEDLILALDSDLNDELDYRELAMGMGLWKIEKRESKRKLISGGNLSHSPTKYSQVSGFESPERPEKDSHSSVSSPVKSKSESSATPKEPKPDSYISGNSPSRIRSALSTISSRSSPYLEPPEPDLRPEQYVLGSQEAMLDRRKRDRDALKFGNKQISSIHDVCHFQQPKGSTKKTKEGSHTEVKSMVKTGDKAVDNHMNPSTLGGETAELVDKFRQLKLREFNDISKLCAENHVPFNEELLKKVLSKPLLFPPDKPHSVLKKHLRQPAMPLHSIDFADAPTHKRSTSPGARWDDPYKRSSQRPSRSHRNAPSGNVSPSYRSSGTSTKESPGSYGVASKDTVERLENARRESRRESYVSRVSHSDRGTAADSSDTDTGQQGAGSRKRIGPLAHRGKQAYPPRSQALSAPEKVNLSTGKAVIRGQVDCWLTFEEYDQMTSHLASKYNQVHGPSDDNAFWPGHLLDKIRLHMPKPEPKASSLFHSTKQQPRTNVGYHNDLQTWPVSEAGYVQFGFIDPYHNKYI